MKSNRIDLRCTLSDGNVFVTGFNGSLQDALEYYNDFVYSYQDESTAKVVKVERF